MFLMVVASLPSVGGYTLSPTFQTALRTLSSFTGISIAASFLYKVLFQPMDTKERIKETKQVFQEVIDRYEREITYGFAGFTQEMDYGRIFRECSQGDELWWHDTYCPSLVNWIDDLLAAVNRGAIVRMLIQKPDCQNAEFRKLELGDEYFADNYIKELQQFRNTLANHANSLHSSRGKLELREYDDLPGVPIYLTMRNGNCMHAHTSFFLGKATGVGFPHLHWIGGENDMMNYFSEYLNKKWENADPIENALSADAQESHTR
jgi:hypothetical protein